MTRPSTPRSNSRLTSPAASPWSRGAPSRRRFVGRWAFSLRSVHTSTSRPARNAASRPGPGSPIAPQRRVAARGACSVRPSTRSRRSSASAGTARSRRRRRLDHLDLEVTTQLPEHVGLEGHHADRPERSPDVAPRRIATSDSSNGIRMPLNNAACLTSMCTPSCRPARADSCSLRSSSSSRVSTGSRSSYKALPGRFFGQRSRARSSALLEVEVLHEPSVHDLAVDLHRPSLGANSGRLGNVRRRGEVEIVAADQDAVAGAHHVGLDRVGATAPGQLVGQRRVLGSVAAGTPVSDDEWSGHAPTVAGPGDGTMKPLERNTYGGRHADDRNPDPPARTRASPAARCTGPRRPRSVGARARGARGQDRSRVRGDRRDDEAYEVPLEPAPTASW